MDEELGAQLHVYQLHTEIPAQKPIDTESRLGRSQDYLVKQEVLENQSGNRADAQVQNRAEQGPPQFVQMVPKTHLGLVSITAHTYFFSSSFFSDG